MNRTLAAALLLSCILGELFLPYKAYHGLPWWHSIPGTYALFGFLSALVLVAFAKILGATGISHHKDDD